MNGTRKKKQSTKGELAVALGATIEHNQLLKQLNKLVFAEAYSIGYSAALGGSGHLNGADHDTFNPSPALMLTYDKALAGLLQQLLKSAGAEGTQAQVDSINEIIK